MPTNVAVDLDVSWPRRGDPDPVVGVGEALDPNRQYLYTWLRLGPVRIRMRSRAIARRTLEALHSALEEALTGAELPADANGSEAFVDEAAGLGAAPHGAGKKRAPSRTAGGRTTVAPREGRRSAQGG